MKFVFIIGSGAVGKMTVGQELMKQTGLRLFHNHMTIEPVIEIFGHFDGQTVNELRDTIFRRFAASSDQKGMIFTYMWAFDLKSDWDYIEHVKSFFAPYGTEFYCVELIAPKEVRLQRNSTPNRLQNKASKRNTEFSAAMIEQEEGYRLVSHPGEVPFENYLRIDNTHLSAEEAATIIREHFNL